MVNFDARTVRVVLEPSKGYKGPVSEERYTHTYTHSSCQTVGKWHEMHG